MYAYKDSNGNGYIAEGFDFRHGIAIDFRYQFATAAEVERFAAAMHLPINWI